MGYTLATYPKKFDAKANKKCNHILLLPISRGGITGYETWSQEVREKIVKTLKSDDVYEGRVTKKEGLLPDHKFPEIRWDLDTKRDSLEGLTDHEIKKDFQLMSNQRNQQKREVCRNCFQTGSRGTVYGVNYFYHGGMKWDQRIPKQGKAAEQGCIGCSWYDLEAWRTDLNKAIFSF
jgi:hypothetical protein